LLPAWSSYAANATGKKIEWLTPHGEYLALGSEESKRLAAYQVSGVASYRRELKPERRPNLSDRFIEL
jgi:hypothetical protein